MEILIDRLNREHKVQVNAGRPQVSYREAVQGSSTGECRYEKIIGGDELFAYVKVKVNQCISLNSRDIVIMGDHPLVPKDLLLAIETGLREGLDVGPIASFPMIQTKVELLNVEYIQDKSSELAFKAAASLSLRDALGKLDVKIFEPIFKLEIVCPENFIGTIVADLNSRKGRVLSFGLRGASQLIHAEAPLGSLFGYATDIRSITQGRASFSMEFKEYAILPQRASNELLKTLGRI